MYCSNPGGRKGCWRDMFATYNGHNLCVDHFVAALTDYERGQVGAAIEQWDIDNEEN